MLRATRLSPAACPASPLHLSCCKRTNFIVLVSGSALREPERFLYPFGRAIQLRAARVVLSVRPTLADEMTVPCNHDGWHGSTKLLKLSPWRRAPVLLFIGNSSAGNMGCTMGAPATGSFLFTLITIHHLNMARGPDRPVKTCGPPHGLDRAAHIKPTSHGPRSDPAHQNSSL